MPTEHSHLLSPQLTRPTVAGQQGSLYSPYCKFLMNIAEKVVNTKGEETLAAKICQTSFPKAFAIALVGVEFEKWILGARGQLGRPLAFDSSVGRKIRSALPMPSLLRWFCIIHFQSGRCLNMHRMPPHKSVLGHRA